MPALGQPMLHDLVARLRAVSSIDEIVLATTTNATNDPLLEFADKEKMRVFRINSAVIRKDSTCH
jgi:spore coat polysaccharide biosynthesis protein SpsF